LRSGFETIWLCKLGANLGNRLRWTDADRGGKPDFGSDFATDACADFLRLAEKAADACHVEVRLVDGDLLQ
jgi:hypothetical protein